MIMDPVKNCINKFALRYVWGLFVVELDCGKFKKFINAPKGYHQGSNILHIFSIPSSIITWRWLLFIFS